jgi:WD40 repeat protein
MFEARDRAYGVAFSPVGGLLATGHGDNIARVWDTKNGQLVRELHGHTNWVLEYCVQSTQSIFGVKTTG